MSSNDNADKLDTQLETLDDERRTLQDELGLAESLTRLSKMLGTEPSESDHQDDLKQRIEALERDRYETVERMLRTGGRLVEWLD